jgi:hypothetical protein
VIALFTETFTLDDTLVVFVFDVLDVPLDATLEGDTSVRFIDVAARVTPDPMTPESTATPINRHVSRFQVLSFGLD